MPTVHAHKHVAAMPRPPHPAPNVRDGHETPLFGARDGRDYTGDLGWGQELLLENRNGHNARRTESSLNVAVEASQTGYPTSQVRNWRLAITEVQYNRSSLSEANETNPRNWTNREVSDWINY
jgi:hypothetical protein